ncbi:MAG: flagellar hook-basal body complex protein FliE [Oscillospiraceae bacterium]|nr:flagellar hook-basal body complex protein FliE [Oscillospiraceae bacterium]
MNVLTPIYNSIPPIQTIEQQRASKALDLEEMTVLENPGFLDVFRGIVVGAAQTQEQKTTDMLDLMLGNTDDIEGIQSNIAKAEIATDLLVTVKNTVVDSYNEIIKMSI